MKEAQLAQTRDGMEKHNGIMLASTWLQCAPSEGIGGPFVKPGGHSRIQNVNIDIDTLHPCFDSATKETASIFPR